MVVRLLKSKITARATHCKEEYEGSITIPEEVAKRAHLLEYEEVFVNGVNNRIRTYVLFGKPKEYQLNGNAAHYFEPGEKIHILSFASVTKHDAFFIKQSIITDL